MGKVPERYKACRARCTTVASLPSRVRPARHADGSHLSAMSSVWECAGVWVDSPSFLRTGRPLWSFSRYASSPSTQASVSSSSCRDTEQEAYVEFSDLLQIPMRRGREEVVAVMVEEKGEWIACVCHLAHF